MQNNDQKIVIIDYGMGNLRSVENKFKQLKVPAIITSDLAEIEKADKLILPGVGHFANGMKNLREAGMIELLNKKVLVDKTPILGICLGMQLFGNSSEECDEETPVKGLGWIDAQTIKFQIPNARIKIPHMGWNSLNQEKEHKLLTDISEDEQFYFVHSYHVQCNDPQDILTSSSYGLRFSSSVQKENIIGVQYHPEKSHDIGIKMIKNFLEM